MSTETLTSLAILKVTIDEGGDYLKYLQPFILQVLVDEMPDPVTETVVHGHIREKFGLEIPEPVIQIVLKRIARTSLITKESGVYRITGELSDPGILTKKNEVNRQIQEVIHDFIQFSNHTKKPITSDEIAVKAILVFLSQFNISCLKAYLRGTALPPVDDNDSGMFTVLVSKYVMHLQKTNLERFKSFMVMVQGHMLANALLCPDIQDVPKTYKKVTFYLDTPLLVQKLGLEGKPRNKKIENLITLLKNLGGSTATFSHSRDELVGVLRGAAYNIDKVDSRGGITAEARRVGRTKSDLLLEVEKTDDNLTKARIEIKQTPYHISKFQIDEIKFEEILEGKKTYRNPKAREYDINSVRSIYVLRGTEAPTSIEKAKAVLVTSNSPFAQAAWEYGQNHHDTSRDVSSVITDFTLANMAWLKSPMDASSLPEIEVLAFSYAALQPSEKLLDKFLVEMERIDGKNIISPRDHQLLRSAPVRMVHDELMNFTLGDESALTDETLTEVAERVSQEIKREETEKLNQEKNQHKETQKELTLEQSKLEKVQETLYRRCNRNANRLSYICAGFLILLVICCVVVSIWWGFTNSFMGWMIATLTATIAICSYIWGASVMEIRKKIKGKLLEIFLKRESNAMDLILEDK